MDIKTVMIICTLTYFLCTFVLFLLWKYNHSRFNGLTLLLINFTLITIGSILVSMRGLIPDWLSIVFSNMLVMTGALIGLMGLERFTNQKGIHIHNYILLVAFAATHYYFTFIYPSLNYRTLNIAIVLFILCFQSMWLMFFRVKKEYRKLTFGVGLVYAALCTSNIFRSIELLYSPIPTNDFLKTGNYDMLFIISYQLLMILLTYCLALMVNGFLQQDVKFQKEKFSKAFHSSPYAILLTRLSDGIIFEANSGFQKISGYSISEAINTTSLALNLWANPSEREYIINELSSTGHIQEKEIQFRKKNGDIIITLFSADIVTINGEKAILSSISDITERKTYEKQIHNLLDEKELILKEVHHRIKNNMNNIFILLSIQSTSQKNAETSKALQTAASRVQSMMVLYDKLYRSGNINEISINKYFPPLVNEIAAIYPTVNTVKINTDLEDIILSAKILSPLGLIINELITNSLKYAFTNITNGEITLMARQTGNHISIIYKDNGLGLPENMTPEKSSGFGMQLISMLVKQLSGNLKIESERNVGTKYLIEFDL